MQCPVCNSVNLVMSERSGIEIDYCPQCRGIWLDRGELDKIIERSSNQNSKENSREFEKRDEYKYSYGNGYSKNHYPRKKRESFFLQAERGLGASAVCCPARC